MTSLGVSGTSCPCRRACVLARKHRPGHACLARIALDLPLHDRDLLYLVDIICACLVRHRWRYKQTVMANLYPNFGNFYSLVPPFLRTGNNFGCTAFVASLYRLISSGRLPKSVTTGFRQTDGGSDADGKTSHGLHYVLVREGTFDRLLWGRLRTGHTHMTGATSRSQPLRAYSTRARVWAQAARRQWSTMLPLLTA